MWRYCDIKSLLPLGTLKASEIKIGSTINLIKIINEHCQARNKAVKSDCVN